MPDPRPALAAPAAALLLLAGCSGGGSGSPDAEPSVTSTPLTDYQLRDVALARAPYCDRISATGVVGALDGTADDDETWANGEPARLAEGVRDVAHEFGCRYTRDDAVAETWLFAPPVTTERAGQLADRARSAPDCRPASDAPPFGRPSVALVCSDGAASTASYRGLFGDAWLTCALTRTGGPAERLTEDAGTWCVQVVEAVRVR